MVNLVDIIQFAKLWIKIVKIQGMLRSDLLWLWRQLSQCNGRTPGTPVIKNVALLGVVFYQRWLRVLDSESSVLLAWAETRSTEIITNRLWAWYEIFVIFVEFFFWPFAKPFLPFWIHCKPFQKVYFTTQFTI